MALNEEWLQEVVSSIELPPISPSVVRVFLPTVEMQIRKLIQQAHKFQRRGKKQSLTVEDFNLALAMNNLEPLYGLFPSTSSSSQPTTSLFNKTKLVDLVKNPLPPYPLKQELTLHWLVVEGVQPTIPENPTLTAPSLFELRSSQQQQQQQDIGSSKESILTATTSTTSLEDISSSTSSGTSLSLVSLPKEMQLVYLRIIRALESRDVHTVTDTTLTAVYEALLTDPAMQILVPHLCLFIYIKVRETSKTLDLLTRLIRAVKSLVLNTSISLEFHIQQLLPAVFTCVVGSQQLPSIDTVYTYYTTQIKKSNRASNNGSGGVSVVVEKGEEEEEKVVFGLSTSNDSSSWALRVAASEVVSMCCAKYSAVFPDLRARVIQTFIEGLGVMTATTASATANTSVKSLGTVYGAVAGVAGLGSVAVGGVLLPRLPALLTRFEILVAQSSSYFSSSTATIANASIAQLKTSTAVKTSGMVGTGNCSSGSTNKESRQQQQLQQESLFQLRLILIQTLGRYAIYVLQQVQADTSIFASGGRRRSSSDSVYQQQPLKKRRRIIVASSSSLLRSHVDKTSSRQRHHHPQQSLHQDNHDNDSNSSHLPLTSSSQYTALTSGLEESMSVYVAAAAAASSTATAAYYSANQLCGTLFL